MYTITPLKRISFVFTLFLITNIFAGDLYLRVTGGIANWGDYTSWSTDSVNYENSGQLKPHLGVTVVIDAKSFQNPNDELYINIDAECNNFNINSSVTLKHKIILPFGKTLSIGSSCSFSDNTNFIIDGTLKLGTSLNGGTAAMGFSGANLSTSGGGELVFDGGNVNGAGSIMNIIGDLFFDNGKMSIIAGTVFADGTKIKCKDFSVSSAVDTCALDFSDGTELEITGDLNLNYVNLSHNFGLKNVKIILNNKSNPNGSTNKLFCSDCNFGASNLEMAPKAVYNLGFQILNDLIFNKITLGDSSKLLFYINKKLKFNEIECNGSLNQLGQAVTFLTGNFNPNSSILEDMDGGSSCLFNLDIQYWSFYPANLTDSIYVSDAISLNKVNLVGNFSYKMKGIGHVVSVLGNSPITLPDTKVKLYKESSIGFGVFDVIDSSDATNGTYQFNINKYNKGGKYLIGASVSASTGNLPGYYTRDKSGNDTLAAFLWENAFVYNYSDGFGCYQSIEDTIRLDTVATFNGTGSIQGKVVEGPKYGLSNGKLVGGGSVFGINDGVGDIKVGLGKNPPGKIVAMTVTDNSGNYSFDNLPSGNYEILVDIGGLDLVATHTVTLNNGETSENNDFVADSANVVPFNSTGIKPINNLKNLSVYPNPFSNFIAINYNFDSDNVIAKLDLINVLGQQVFTINLTLLKGRQASTIDLSNTKILPGIYFVNLYSNGGQYTARLVKN